MYLPVKGGGLLIDQARPATSLRLPLDSGTRSGHDGWPRAGVAGGHGPRTRSPVRGGLAVKETLESRGRGRCRPGDRRGLPSRGQGGHHRGGERPGFATRRGGRAATARSTSPRQVPVAASRASCIPSSATSALAPAAASPPSRTASPASSSAACHRASPTRARPSDHRTSTVGAGRRASGSWSEVRALGAAEFRDSVPDGAAAGVGQLYRVDESGAAVSVADLAAYETGRQPGCRPARQHRARLEHQRTGRHGRGRPRGGCGRQRPAHGGRGWRHLARWPCSRS